MFDNGPLSLKKEAFFEITMKLGLIHTYDDTPANLFLPPFYVRELTETYSTKKHLFILT